ncbi:MAG: hypothetical protein J6A50_01220 [Clostridia bacterium]|nr:hypothetical protein [Clostridia bacterium]
MNRIFKNIAIKGVAVAEKIRKRRKKPQKSLPLRTAPESPPLKKVILNTTSAICPLDSIKV